MFFYQFACGEFFASTFHKIHHQQKITNFLKVDYESELQILSINCIQFANKF